MPLATVLLAGNEGIVAYQVLAELDEDTAVLFQYPECSLGTTFMAFS